MAREVAELLRRSPKALDLAARERRITVRGREMRHQTDDFGRRRRQLREAVAAHAGVQLEVDAHPLRDLTVGDHELEAGIARLRNLAVRAGGSQHDDAFGAVLAAQREAFRNRRDAERRRARAERGACDVDRAVTVAVGFDHRPEPRTVERAQERSHVASQSPEVDGDLRAVH